MPPSMHNEASAVSSCNSAMSIQAARATFRERDCLQTCAHAAVSKQEMTGRLLVSEQKESCRGGHMCGVYAYVEFAMLYSLLSKHMEGECFECRVRQLYKPKRQH